MPRSASWLASSPRNARLAEIPTDRPASPMWPKPSEQSWHHGDKIEAKKTAKRSASPVPGWMHFHEGGAGAVARDRFLRRSARRALPAVVGVAEGGVLER